MDGEAVSQIVDAGAVAVTVTVEGLGAPKANTPAD